jgi:hypothetical protein
MNSRRLPFRLAAAVALLLAAGAAHAGEIYAGIGTTGVELGVASRLGSDFAGRLEADALSVKRNLSTSNVDYDTKMKFVNAAVYLDWFVAGGMRFTAGALVGDRKVHGTAKSLGNTISLNGVVYPVAAGDSLDFDARFPTVAPYLGIGFGHHRNDPGWHLYADAGTTFGRAKVRLSPSASLAAKINPGDLAAEQALAQDKADGLRVYPVLKIGVAYAF